MDNSYVEKIGKAMVLAQAQAEKSCMGLASFAKRNVYASNFRAWLDTFLQKMFPNSEVLYGPYNCLKTKIGENCWAIAMAQKDAEHRPSKRTVDFDLHPYLFEDMEKDRLYKLDSQHVLISYILEDERIARAYIFSRSGGFEPVSIPLEEIEMINDEIQTKIDDYAVIFEESEVGINE